jgi:hypothetical protein
VKTKPQSPFENFTKAMDGLMRFPHSEIKKTLEREKRGGWPSFPLTQPCSGCPILRVLFAKGGWQSDRTMFFEGCDSTSAHRLGFFAARRNLTSTLFHHKRPGHASPTSNRPSTFAGRRARQSSFVYFAAVTDSRHLRQRFCVVDGVHRAVVTHANAPLAIPAF